MSAAIEWSGVEPIDALGWCVKRLDDHYCIDVRQMLAGYRVLLTRRSRSGEHVTYEHGWCYFGAGEDVRGHRRTMETARVAAFLAAQAWDGSGAPAGFDKQAV